VHLLGGEAAVSEQAAALAEGHGGRSRTGELEQEVQRLREELDQLRAEFDAFRAQFQ
jgi:uncharacterized protein YceH (UPF0502 family)